MKYSEDAERDLLVRLERDDEGRGLDFVYARALEHIDINSPLRLRETCDHTKEYQVTQMEKRRFVELQSATKTGFTLALTPAGHDRLAWRRDNTFSRQFARWCGRWADRVLASIITPIIVSIFTVWALDYLGLTK